MSQRLVRCGHCGLPHPASSAVCPTTGKRLERLGSSRPAPPSQGSAQGSAPPRRADDHKHLVGRTVGGKYHFSSILGEGGMGTVFAAKNLAVGRSVAIKVLHPHQAKKKVAVQRFHQEAKSAGRIGHPNICEVYDLGTLDDGIPFLVMEKLTGQTLAERIAAEGGLPFGECLDIVSQVLSGLTAAHEKGIVHRDIKPENVFLCERADGPALVKILDFGVSKMVAPDAEELDLTRTGMVMGTPYYMSPEQARGDRNLDARVDIWACGVILYEALTGKRPFVAANYNALLLQILTASPRPVRELRPNLPEDIEPVLARALARARERRYPTARAFQQDVGIVLANDARRSLPPPEADDAGEDFPRRFSSRRLPPPPPPPRPAAVGSRSFGRMPSRASRSSQPPPSPSMSAGEGAGRLPPSFAPVDAGFDDQPTEITGQTWDDETRKSRGARAEMLRVAAKARAKSAPPPAPTSSEARNAPVLHAPVPAVADDTVKIEGDVEEHFARLDAEVSRRPPSQASKKHR